jgi:UDP-2,3-diacylglucosamine hydrolase
LLLISDLHLEAGRPDISDALVGFLRHKAVSAPRLYILGDLFEVWLGDDTSDPLAERVAAEFRRLTSQGVELFIMHGNRDFLLGADYASRCGASLLTEPAVLTVGNRRIALLHGDVLCTRDTEYLQFRKLVRDPAWQQQFLAQPLAQRQAFARQARQQSQQTTSSTAAEIMDVTPAAVTDLFQALKVDVIIHGHTHRPAVHDCGPQSQRVVLGDWDKVGWYGEIGPQGDVSLHQFPLTRN